MKPKNIKESWYRELRHCFDSPEMQKVVKEIKGIHPDYVPVQRDIFKAFSYTEFADTQVVFVYSNHQQKFKVGTKSKFNTGLPGATGGPQFDTKATKIIRDSVALDTHDIALEKDFDWSLEHWANQGVLLLNPALTAPIKGKMFAHYDLWKFFTGEVLYKLSTKLTGLIFVAIGNVASTLIEHYAVLDNHYIIEACHPLETYEHLVKNGFNSDKIEDKYNFTSYEVFKEINEILETLTGEHINWNK